MDQDAHGPTGPNHHGGTDIEAPLDKAIPCPRYALLCGLAHGADELALVASRAEFGTDTKESRQSHALDELPSVGIDAVAKTRIA